MVQGVRRLSGLLLKQPQTDEQIQPPQLVRQVLQIGGVTNPALRFTPGV
jgi:hypothetical protein